MPVTIFLPGIYSIYLITTWDKSVVSDLSMWRLRPSYAVVSGESGRFGCIEAARDVYRDFKQLQQQTFFICIVDAFFPQYPVLFVRGSKGAIPPEFV